MVLNGGQAINNVKHQCEILKEGEEKAVVIKKISEELYKQMEEVVTKTGCKIVWDKETNRVKIYKEPKIKNKNDDTTDDLEALINTAIERGDKQINKKAKNVEKKYEEINRLSLMNPTREFCNFAKNFDKFFKEGKYNKLLDDAEKVKKAIAYPVDKEDYNIWIKVYKNRILPEINKKLNNIPKNKKNILERLKKVIIYIIKNTKAKDIGLS